MKTSIRPSSILLSIFIFASAIMSAQNNVGHTWSKAINAVQPLGGSVEGRSIVVDAAGNIYVAGYFQLTSDFDPGPAVFNLVSNGGYDIFIAKYDASGNFIMAKSVGGLSDDLALDIALDGSNNIYITGRIAGAIDFDPGPANFTINSLGGHDAIFAKYDGAIDLIYARSMAGSSDDIATTISVSNSGVVVVGGYFNGTTDFDPGAGVANQTAVGSNDAFVARYDATGNYVFAHKLGGTSSDIVYSLAIDVVGDVYVGGIFYNTIDFDPGVGTASLTSAGGYDIFLAKYTATGTYVFANRIGGISDDIIYGIDLGTTGNIYMAGNYNGTADFDPGAGTASLTSIGSSDIFIASYSASGNYLFAKSMGGTSVDIAFEIHLDPSDNIYITGRYIGTADFDPGAGTANLSGPGGNEIFLAKYDASANYIWAVGMVGPGSGVGYGIALDATGNVFVTGGFDGNVYFDPMFPGYQSPGLGAYNGFLVSFNSTGSFRNVGVLGGYSTVVAADMGRSITTDPAGNVYITGQFNGTLDFDPGAGLASLTSAGNGDVFIAKYDAGGNFIYAKAVGGANNDIAHKVVIDASGNVFITGYFAGTADFDPGPATASLTSAGSNDIFFAKYNSSGDYVFAFKIGGTGNDIGMSLAIDGSGNINLTGQFSNTVDFNPGAGVASATSAGNLDIFIAKYDASGNYINSRRIGNAAEDQSVDIVLDGTGNIYITGRFFGTVDFDPGVGTAALSSSGDYDAFFAKYDASLIYSFAMKAGGTGYDFSNSIALDPNGNIYMSGSFSGTADFDPGAGAANLTSFGSTDLYFAKYGPSGNYLYAKGIGNTSDDQSYCVSTDANGNAYIVGHFRGTIDADPGAGTANLTSLGFQDIVFGKYDATGNYVYAKSVGSIGTDIGYGITTDASGNILLTGNFAYNIDLDPHANTVIHSATNSTDIFIAKYSGCSGPVIAYTSTPSATATISGATAVTDGGCALLATITPNGVSPVSGNISGKVWLEASVPVHAGQPFVSRHYEITPATNPATATAKVTLYFTQQEFDAFNAHAGSLLDLPANSSDASGIANLRVGKYSGSSSDGTGLPASYSTTAMVIDPADNEIVWNSTLNRWEVSFDVAGFSGFVVQTSLFVLPVTLLEFKGKLASNNGLLNWKTSNEVNTRSYEIERSIDGRIYTTIGQVNAVNTTGIHDYAYTDNNIQSLGVKKIYYRLKQKDIDGRISYSNIVVLALDNSNLLFIYPNPVTDKLNLTITLNRAERVQIRIVDNMGRVVKQQSLDLAAGSITLPVNLETLAKGMYWLELKGEAMNSKRQFVKQ